MATALLTPVLSGVPAAVGADSAPAGTGDAFVRLLDGVLPGAGPPQPVAAALPPVPAALPDLGAAAVPHSAATEPAGGATLGNILEPDAPAAASQPVVAADRREFRARMVAVTKNDATVQAGSPAPESPPPAAAPTAGGPVPAAAPPVQAAGMPGAPAQATAPPQASGSAAAVAPAATKAAPSTSAAVQASVTRPAVRGESRAKLGKDAPGSASVGPDTQSAPGPPPTADRGLSMDAPTNPVVAAQPHARRADVGGASTAAASPGTAGVEGFKAAVPGELAPTLAGAGGSAAAHLPSEQSPVADASPVQAAKAPGVPALGSIFPAAPPSAGATGSSVAGRTPAGAAGSAVPAATVAPVLLHLARTDDVQRLTVRLDPAELGAVEIRVERAATGPARVEFLAAHAGTLDFLRTDSVALNRALDAAGVPAEGRQISFSLGGSGDAAGGGGSGNAGGSAFGAPGQGGSHGGQNAYGRNPAQLAASVAASAASQSFGVDLLA